MNAFAAALDQATERLCAGGIPSPRMEARLLLAHVAGASQEDIVAGRVAPDDETLARFARAVARRAGREPLAYITGSREFWSLDFAVGPGVLVPRPETETLIEEALKEFPERDTPLRVLDLGTGSGCILIAFLKERPRATGTGADISELALSWAERNARNLGVADRMNLAKGDWADALGGAFDAIFCNPPYVMENAAAALAPEPKLALSGGADGLDAYRRIAPQIYARLAAQGRAFVELGAGQASDAAAIFANARLDVLRIAPDLAGIPRCLVAARGP